MNVPRLFISIVWMYRLNFTIRASVRLVCVCALYRVQPTIITHIHLIFYGCSLPLSGTTVYKRIELRHAPLVYNARDRTVMRSPYSRWFATIHPWSSGFVIRPLVRSLRGVYLLDSTDSISLRRINVCNSSNDC